MKKLLILTMIIASCLLSACNNSYEKFEKIASTEAVNETVEYIISANAGATENDIKPTIMQWADHINVAVNLKLDIEKEYDTILAAMGGEEVISQAKANGVPESYINLTIAYQASEAAISEYMEKNDLFKDVDLDEYFKENYWRAKHVLIATEGMDDAQKAEAKAKAEDVLARAKAGEDFSAMVAELSEDPGSASQPDGYVFTTGEMVPQFEDGTKNTQIGDFTLVETSYGYHVIQRLALDETPELYEQFFTAANVEDIMKTNQIIEFVNENK